MSSASKLKFYYVTLLYRWLKIFEDAEGGLLSIARSYNRYGLHVLENGDIEYLEWAPGANSVSLFGDFNGWNREEYRAGKNEFG